MYEVLIILKYLPEMGVSILLLYMGILDVCGERKICSLVNEKRLLKKNFENETFCIIRDVLIVDVRLGNSVRHRVCTN